jgi:hypothetical protein
MKDESSNRSPSGHPRHSDRGGNPALPGAVILVILTVIALVCVIGYFFLMKLIEISRQEDCMLAGRRNCAPIEVPSGR